MTLPSAGPRPRVLIVEDDGEIRRSIADVLADEGYAIAEAANGAEALARLRGGDRPDLILLDVMMPVMDGAQFRAEQMEDSALAAIPVVVLTADGRAPDWGQSLGAAVALAKPPRLDDLLAAVARLSERGAG